MLAVFVSTYGTSYHLAATVICCTSCTVQKMCTIPPVILVELYDDRIYQNSNKKGHNHLSEFFLFFLIQLYRQTRISKPFLFSKYFLVYLIITDNSETNFIWYRSIRYISWKKIALKSIFGLWTLKNTVDFNMILTSFKNVLFS